MNATANDSPVALVVDDDSMMRLLLRQTLEGNGFIVYEAEAGRAALTSFTEIRPAIVLLDVMMPGLDGFEVCAALRAMPEGQRTPIIMLTGLDDIPSIQRAYDMGATDFILKPINWLILAHRVRYILRAHDAFERLAESQGRLHDAQRIAKLGSWRWDLRTDMIEYSEEARRILEITSGDGFHHSANMIDRVHPKDRESVRKARENAHTQLNPYGVEYRLGDQEGIIQIVREQGEIECDSLGQAIVIRGTVQDISDIRNAEERIRFLACYDTLTGLSNRSAFRERVEQAMRHNLRYKRTLAVFLLDIDDFKRINDTLGHGTGDKLLMAIATRIESLIRCTDTFGMYSPETKDYELARLGGDEFGILLPEISRADDTTQVAKRLIDALTKPFPVEGTETFITASIGIAIHPADGASVDDLLKNADSAMFHAKDQGRNNYQFYSPAMNTRALERLTMENNLRKALERDELILNYQPKLNLATGEIEGVEALVRWQHPELGLVPPIQFIPIAESTGLIVPMDEWVLATATRQVAAWHRAGLRPISLAVNMSGLGFRQPNLVDMVSRALTDSGLEPRFLEMELTETMLMDNTEDTRETLQRLAAMGIRLSIDDFGTGYSSLSYLKRFPLSVLKIDRSFVKDATKNSDDAGIVTAIIQMAHCLKLVVVAEGVETVEQLVFLHGRGCDVGQGYLFSRPERAERIEELLRTGWRYEVCEGSGHTVLSNVVALPTTQIAARG